MDVLARQPTQEARPQHVQEAHLFLHMLRHLSLMLTEVRPGGKGYSASIFDQMSLSCLYLRSPCAYTRGARLDGTALAGRWRGEAGRGEAGRVEARRGEAGHRRAKGGGRGRRARRADA